MSALRRHQLIAFLVSWCFIQGALSALTRTPMNVLIQKGDDVSLECSTDAYATINTISWSYDSAFVTTIPCSATDVARFQVSQPVPLNDCFLTALGTSATGNYGPYGCSDGSGLTAEAVAILIDPIPTCGVVTSPPIRGQDVTLSCTTAYQRLSDDGRLNPGATLTPSISWESAAGTLIGTSSTNDVRQGTIFGATLQANVSTLASGTEIPSYNCTTTFNFFDVSTVDFVFALNSLTWTCVSAPVLTWYCPSSVNVTPSAEPFNEGDVLTCTSDGYPQPSYSWTDADGVVVSTTSKVALPRGVFNLTCTATGNFTTPCSASFTVSGNASESNLTTTIAGVDFSTVGTNGTDGGDDGDDDGIDTNLIIGIAAAVGALLLALLLVYLIWLCVRWMRRRKDEEEEDGKPRKRIAFYQAVRAGRPAHLSRAQNHYYRMNDFYGCPRCVDQRSGYCGAARCSYAPRYARQSMAISKF